jgi:GAF domain-containing protein
MKWMPSRLKWLSYFPIIMIDKILTFVRYEKRWWVLLMVFIASLSFTFKDLIADAFAGDPIPTQVETSNEVNRDLKQLIDEGNASRAYIFQFHNGITFYTGQHAQRFSCTYEVVNEGVSREAENLQNLQVSLFSWWINEVLSGRMTYFNIDDMADYTSRMSLQQQGIKSIVCRPLINKGKVVGILGLDYVGWSNDIVNDPDFIMHLEEKAAELAKAISE